MIILLPRDTLFFLFHFDRILTHHRSYFASQCQLLIIPISKDYVTMKFEFNYFPLQLILKIKPMSINVLFCQNIFNPIVSHSLQVSPQYKIRGIHPRGPWPQGSASFLIP